MNLNEGGRCCSADYAGRQARRAWFSNFRGARGSWHRADAIELRGMATPPARCPDPANNHHFLLSARPRSASSAVLLEETETSLLKESGKGLQALDHDALIPVASLQLHHLYRATTRLGEGLPCDQPAGATLSGPRAVKPVSILLPTPLV
jgi:hypothetical protein